MKSINPRDYYHESDKKALEALKEIPGFTVALKAFMKIFSEQQIHGLNMANKVRLGKNQLPEIYNLLPPICQVLGIPEPELYLEMDPYPNAYTTGDSLIFITITSGLLECLEEDEIKAVIAHECGHIACHHVLYHTMGNIILNGGAEILNLGLLSVPLKIGFNYWERCSELSCDRAAAIYMKGPDSVVETMIRLAGGNKAITSKINKELYISQAQEYEKLIQNSALNKTLQYLVIMNQDHPFNSVRASEITKWCNSPNFQKIMEYLNTPDSLEKLCPKCGKPVQEEWMFCKNCGYKLF